MKTYYIEFLFDNYCQGWDRDVWGRALVYADTFEEACQKIIESNRFENAHSFKDNTIF